MSRIKVAFFLFPLLIGIVLFSLYKLGMMDSNLFKAIKSGDVEDVRKTLSNDEAEAKQYQGSITPLHQAAYYNQTKIARLLIEYGADVNAKGGRHNFTPIFIAASKGDVNFIKLLIDNGAEVNVKDDLNQTPLIAAVLSKSVQSVKILINSGANVELKDKNNKSALDYALKNGEMDIIKILRKTE